MLFVVERRAFGRQVLVGTHVVQSLMDFATPDLWDEPDEEEEEPKPKCKPPTSLWSKLDIVTQCAF